ncbi:hypothetical protein HK098_004381 [Nowakowskiella sp. JEL0407]|nr:hypothetical protein HK098_004381 [Nowakowskiella sp. JEL0407]
MNKRRTSAENSPQEKNQTVGGISVQELNLLEVEFCIMVQWKLAVDRDLLQQYYLDLVRISTRFVLSESSTAQKPPEFYLLPNQPLMFSSEQSESSAFSSDTSLSSHIENGRTPSPTPSANSPRKRLLGNITWKSIKEKTSELNFK